MLESARSVLEAIARQLQKAGVESAQIDAQWLLAHAMGVPRGHWHLRGPLTPSEQQRLQACVERRCQREPLQYILKSAPFGELMLEVDARVLIPRPETETLLEQITQYAPESLRWFLDLGTGSGALALGLAQHYPQARGVAADLSAQALEVAQGNVTRLGFRDRIACVVSDWFSNVDGTFDLIVANPPYLTQEEWAHAAPEVRDHEPLSALVAADAGLADLNHLLAQAPCFLNPGGCLVLETGLGHPPILEAQASALPYTSTRITQDLLQRERFFWAYV